MTRRATNATVSAIFAFGYRLKRASQSPWNAPITPPASAAASVTSSTWSLDCCAQARQIEQRPGQQKLRRQQQPTDRADGGPDIGQGAVDQLEDEMALVGVGVQRIGSYQSSCWVVVGWSSHQGQRKRLGRMRR